MKKEVEFKSIQLMSRIAKTLRPKKPMSISEWAEENMVLPQGDAYAGHYRIRNAPYQKEIMDSISDPSVTDVSMMFSAQVGKSLIMNCGVGYYIDYEPSTQIVVLPTQDLAERYSKKRLAPMLRDVKCLADKMSNKSRDTNNTIMSKEYAGGDIIITGANSPSGLAQASRRIAWLDEVDRYPGSAGEEGNPVSLVKERTNSYWNYKFIMVSTPTIKGRSKIEDAFLKGSMDEWMVACPECGEYQPYDFKRLDFESVSMACKSCGVLIKEKEWKKSEHKWVAEHPERKKNRSFHMNAMASPFLDWERIIEKFKDAKKKLTEQHDPKDLQVFINTSLAETWEETDAYENKMDKSEMEERAEEYGAEIPDGVILLTAAVDVQDDRFELEVRGWARDYESWGIYKTEISGNLITDEPWNELEEYLARNFEFEDGRILNIAGFAIDTGGHYTNKVYKWIKYMKSKGLKCYGVKGYAGKSGIPLIYKKTVVEIKDKTARGKDVVIGRTVIHIIGVDSGKEDIMNRLTLTKPGKGYCHFPDQKWRGYDEKYYDGLLSEKKVKTLVKGEIKERWVKKKSGIRNEPLDLFNYNYAVLELINPNWDALEEKLKKGINYMTRNSQKKKSRKSIDGIEVYNT